MSAPIRDTKYLIFRGEVHPIYLSADDNLWRSEDGTVFGLTYDGAFTVPDPACGAGIFELSTKHKLTKYCKVHDYMYSTPAYQAYNEREKADAALAKLVATDKRWGWIAPLFYVLTRVFGGSLWENKRTRDL